MKVFDYIGQLLQKAPASLGVKSSKKSRLSFEEEIIFPEVNS